IFLWKPHLEVLESQGVIGSPRLFLWVPVLIVQHIFGPRITTHALSAFPGHTMVVTPGSHGSIGSVHMVLSADLKGVVSDLVIIVTHIVSLEMESTTKGSAAPRPESFDRLK